MPSRYDTRNLSTNVHGQYKNVFRDRKVNFIVQYTTPSLKFPTVDDITNLQSVGHIWGIGDRFYKLAHEYYNDAELWWVIAFFNQTPTESHVEIGDTVLIPLPLERILEFIDI